MSGARGLTRLDLFKLDVEGAELRVLAGAAASIRRFRPVLSITIYHGFAQLFLIPKYLLETLQDYRYRLTAHSPISTDVVLHCIPVERIDGH